MDKIKLIEHAKGYLEKLAEGTDPISGESVGENDIVKQPRVSKCLSYSASVFARAIDENGVSESHLYIIRTPQIKNEENALRVAADFLHSLAEGKDPTTGAQAAKDDIVFSKRISRCLEFTSEQLKTVILRKSPFSVTEEQLDSFEYSDEPIMISEIKKRADALVDSEYMTGISAAWLTSYLTDLKFLEIHPDENGKTKYKLPTKMGELLGISVKSSESSWGIKYTLLYSRKMQELIVKNIPTIIEKYRNNKMADNSESEPQDKQ